MKTVILIGDSIRMGYQPTVERELAGVARVVAPLENGGDSRNVLAHMREWIGDAPDLIHVNFGLHDLKCPFASQLRQVPLTEYEANVREILTFFSRAASAQLLWASTTPVNHAWHHERKGFDRFGEDIVAYNAAALAIVDELGIPVDDLNAVISRAGRDRLLLPDGVHYGPEGYEILGKTVADRIRPYVS